MLHAMVCLLLPSSKHCILNHFLFSVVCDMRITEALASGDDAYDDLEYSSYAKNLVQ